MEKYSLQWKDGAGHRPAKVPDVRRSRRQRGTKREKERQLQARVYTAEMVTTRRELREAVSMLRELNERTG